MHDNCETITDAPANDSAIIVAGAVVPIGGTLRGDIARAFISANKDAPALLHLAAIGEGKVTISSGLWPTRVAQLPKGDRASRRREVWVLTPSGAAWVHATLSPAAAAIAEWLASAGAAGADKAGRRAFASHAAADWTRRVADLRAIGAIISVVKRGRGLSITRLHSALVLDTPPTDGRPVIEAERIARLAHPEAAIEQARHADTRRTRQINALIEQADLLGYGAALRQRLAREGLQPASYAPNAAA